MEFLFDCFLVEFFIIIFATTSSPSHHHLSCIRNMKDLLNSNVLKKLTILVWKLVKNDHQQSSSSYPETIGNIKLSQSLFVNTLAQNLTMFAGYSSLALLRFSQFSESFKIMYSLRPCDQLQLIYTRLLRCFREIRQQQKQYSSNHSVLNVTGDFVILVNNRNNTLSF